MKIISISTDRKIFETDSAVQMRMKEYGAIFDELHIIVFSSRSLGYKKTQLSENVWAYPTNSFARVTYISSAILLGRKIYRNFIETDDVIVSTQDPFETGLVGFLLKKILKVRLNVQVHTDLYSPCFKQVSLWNRIRLILAPHVLSHAESIRVVSKRIKKSLLERGIAEQAISILPIFVNTDLYDQFQDVARKENTILTVSRLTKEKNIFFLIDIIAEVVIAKPDTYVVIVGDGPERKALEAYTREKKLQEHIEFVGWKHHMDRWYREAGLFVHTSVYEGYGMVMVEAALYHVPMVVSDVGIVGDVLKSETSAKICTVNDKECFVKNILACLQQKKEAQHMAHNAYNAVVKSLPENKEKYLELYKNTL